MSNQENIVKSSSGSAIMMRAMVGIGVMCALLIVSTFEITFPIIAKNKAEALEKAIFRVLPGMAEKKTFVIGEQNIISEFDEAPTDAQIIYAGYNERGELVGMVIEASGQGFADVLRILYGYDPAKEAVVGFYVLESKETPGLGDKIEKDPAFLANFEALDVSLNEEKSALRNAVVPVKKGRKVNAWEVDGITGATISSRAIGKIIGESTSTIVPLIYKHKTLFHQGGLEGD